jgi:hypothetical protein
MLLLIALPVAYFMSGRAPQQDPKPAGPADAGKAVAGKQEKAPDEAPPGPAWTEVRSAEGRFTVRFPGTPKQTSGPGPITTYTLALEGGQETYTVTYNDLPPGTENLDPKFFLDALAQKAGPNVKSKKEVKAGPHTGLELALEGADGKAGVMTQRMFVVNGRMFQALAFGESGKHDPARLTRFLDSFAPTDPPGKPAAAPPQPPPPAPPTPPESTPGVAPPLATILPTRPPEVGAMRDKAVAWVKANNAFGPTHKIVADVARHMEVDVKEDMGFSLAFGAKLMKSRKPTMLGGWNDTFFVFEFPPEQADDLRIPAGTMLFTGIAGDKVQRDRRPVTLSDLTLTKGGTLSAGERIGGSVKYRRTGEAKGTVLLLQLTYQAGKLRRTPFHFIGPTLPAEEGTIRFNYLSDLDAIGYSGGLLLFFDLIEHTGQADKKPVLSNTLAAAVVVQRPRPAAPPPAARKGGLDRLEVKAPAGWKSDYARFLQSWTFEKYTPGPGGLNESSRVRVAESGDVFASADAHAEKLKQKDYVDIEYVFTEITAKESLPDGYLIKGVVRNHKDAKEPSRLGLVMVRTLDGVKVTASSASLRSEALRDEAIQLVRSARLPPEK